MKHNKIESRTAEMNDGDFCPPIRIIQFNSKIKIKVIHGVEDFIQRIQNKIPHSNQKPKRTIIIKQNPTLQNGGNDFMHQRWDIHPIYSDQFANIYNTKI